jgi:hypothetical protein
VRGDGDSAPTFYIPNNPAQTDPLTRTLEHDVAVLVASNPITGATDTLSVFLADQAVMNLLHMVTSVPDRTMNFTMFGNPNYFNQLAPLSQHTTPCSSPPDCVFEAPAFAWNHGDVQSDITTTWFMGHGRPRGEQRRQKPQCILRSHRHTADYVGPARPFRRLRE